MTVAVDVAETTVAELMKSIERGDKVQLRENGQAVAVMSPTSSAEGYRAVQSSRWPQRRRRWSALMSAPGGWG